MTVTTLSSLSFKRLVTALKQTNKTCTVLEQCCGGLINTSIMAQPGASSVFFGGSVAYNTRKAKKLLLNDDALHASLTETPNDVDPLASTVDLYIKSKLDWTAKTSVAFCNALETDYAIAESGAAGPTFRPKGMETGFAVLAVAGKGPDGIVKVLRQEIVWSKHADRERNMRLFADSAADIATEVITGSKVDSAELLKPMDALKLDRATHLRSQAEALAALEPEAKYVILKGTQILVRSTTNLALLSQDDIITIGGEQRKTFLGLLSGDEKPTPVFGIDLLEGHDETALPPTTMFVDTRTTAPLFSSIENELALHATALTQWQRRTSFCSLCGGPTIFTDGGTCCQCTLCKTSSWPRQDPSMIAAISSRDGQRVLLARSKRHPPKLHTVLAGFVEAGETFEAAVARETFEETGIHIDEGSVQYVGPQPWPFPQSCMIGFTATADDTVPLNIDTVELVSARWFDKSEVIKAASVEGPTMQHPVAEAALKNDPTLPLIIPPKGVIARKLIDKWLAD